MKPKIVLVSKEGIGIDSQMLEQTDEMDKAVRSDADIIILDIDSIKTEEIQEVKREKDIVLFTQELTEESLSKMIAYCMEDTIYTYRWNGHVRTLDLNDIYYFESVHRIIKAYREDGRYVQFYKKMDDLYQEIENLKMFIRPGKSHLVNIKYCKFEKEFVTVGEKRIHITRKYRKDLEKYSRF